MSKKKNKNKQEKRSNNIALCSVENWDILCSDQYVPLSKNPEIVAGVNMIADLIATMTIHLMENTDNGDRRVKDELSKKIDINPNRYMTRYSFISALVRTLLLEGEGNAFIYPKTNRGLIEDLFLLPPNKCSITKLGVLTGYKILFDGVEYNPDELIHILINPSPNAPYKGTGYTVTLGSVAKSLKQAETTKNEFMESKWKPGLIIRVDSMIDEFSTEEGRNKILNKYVESTKAGQPWLLPSDGFNVETVKPLSLNDLALKDGVELDKKTVASILQVPPFVLGVGKFSIEEWNNFISTRIHSITTAIAQAFTKSLLISPTRYFTFNYRSLYHYDLKTLADVGMNLRSAGILLTNEVRDSLGYSPIEGGDELVILENYIPVSMLDKQNKLNGGDDDVSE